MNPINCSRDCPQSTCRRELQALLHEVNRHLWTSYKTDPEYMASADLYTITILCLFASVILILMIRSIKPSESVDDQVTILLNSMRVRVEYEDNARQRQKLREAKRKAQRWLAEAKSRSCKKLSFSGSFRMRTKSDSDALGAATPGTPGPSTSQAQGENISLKSNPIATIKSSMSNLTGSPIKALPTKSMPMSTSKTFPRKPMVYQRAASYQFLPEIVVTTSHPTAEESGPLSAGVVVTKGYVRSPSSQSQENNDSASHGINDISSVV